MKKKILVIVFTVCILISLSLVSISAYFECPSCFLNYYNIECGDTDGYEAIGHWIEDPITGYDRYCRYNLYYSVTERECLVCAYTNNGRHKHYVGSHEFECGSTDECVVCSMYLYN